LGYGGRVHLIYGVEYQYSW